MRAGASRPGRACRICGDTVKHQGKRGGGVSEWYTDSRGVRKLALWHKERCWPEEQRQRRAVARVVPVEAESPVDSLAVQALATLEPEVPAWVAPVEPERPLYPHCRNGGRGPCYDVCGCPVEVPADPLPETAATSGSLVTTHMRPGKHRGLKQGVYLAVESYRPGLEWSIDTLANDVVSLGFTTTKATITTYLSSYIREHPGTIERLRTGTDRRYKRIEIEVPSKVEVVEEVPAQGVATPRERPPRPRKEVTATQVNGLISGLKQERQELLGLIDRAYADLQELLIESRRELRKEVERLVR